MTGSNATDLPIEAVAPILLRPASYTHRGVAVMTSAGRHRYYNHRLFPAVTYVPVTQRNFKLSSFSVMAASSRSLPVSNHNKWYHSRQQIDNNPSRRAGLDPDKELSYRQQAANLLQDMGQRLNVYLLSAAVLGSASQH